MTHTYLNLGRIQGTQDLCLTQCSEISLEYMGTIWDTGD